MQLSPVAPRIHGSLAALPQTVAPSSAVAHPFAITPADKAGIAAALHAAQPEPGWQGPFDGPFAYEGRNEYAGIRLTGTAKIYAAAYDGDIWALAAFAGPGTGAMHQPGIYRRVGGVWTAVIFDPAPGGDAVRSDYGVIPAPVRASWGMAAFDPPADAVVITDWQELPPR